ncbi:MAG: hypothetical protein D6722_07930 [Bacteroidetes bacterium]|nr:MAG: hypothetical protein D6722_07930 [Bacteroidota bacterium]
MKKSLILLLFVALATSLSAQKRVLFQDAKVSAYSSVFIKTTNLMNQYNPLVGGMGAVVFDDRFAIGAFGNGMLGQIEFTGTKLENSGDARLSTSFGYGGLVMEYILWSDKAIHLSVPVQLGLGRVGIDLVETGQELEASRMIILEPRLNLEANLSQQITLAANAGYRLTDVKDIYNLTDKNLSGFNFGLQLKIHMDGDR